MILRVLVILFISLLVSIPNAGAISIDDYQPGDVASGIGGSRHNLGSLGRVLRSAATTEVCVFCHTPHHSSALNAPLWNRSSPLGPFTAYGMTSAGSDITTVGGPSLACLSCHDGVTTFDNLVNAPGKDGVVAGGQDRGWLFNMPVGAQYPAVGQVGLDHFDQMPGGACSICHQGALFDLEYIGSMTTGTDLSDDHPVSVAYNEALPEAGLRAQSTVLSTIDLDSELSSSGDPALLSNVSQNRWAVNGFISDTATISDLLKDGNVECTSCHDPHFSNKSWDEADSTYTQPTPTGGWTPVPGWCGPYYETSTDLEDCSDGLFLRRVGGNTGSGICRTCHEQ